MTLKEYYKHFLSIWGAVTAALAGLPLIALIHFPGDVGRYAFPPLGDVENWLRVLTVAVALVITFPAYFTKGWDFFSSKSGRSKFIWKIVIISFLWLVVYGILMISFVRNISIPSSHHEWITTVGYERTPFAQQNFGQLSDWEMLRRRGLEEEQIWSLWSKTSILIVRGGLWISYLLTLLSFTCTTSLAVLFD